MVVVSLAVLGICAPQIGMAVEAAAKPLVVDVALSDGGTLHGRVVDSQNTGVGGATIYVRTQNHDVATTTTAENGTFSVHGLRGGVYQVTTANGHGVYRLWSAGTAPPIAQTSAIVYTQNSAVDGNVVVYTQGSNFKMLLANPIVIAGVVATAIAVPVALANSKSSSP